MSLLTESELRVAAGTIEHQAQPIIRLENVSVEYRAPSERITTFKEYAIRLLQRRVQQNQFKALRNVSLDINQGEVFGVIGNNGAGKSTLLKVISRVMKPTGGRVWVKGRVAPLLELGAGFHPELSGRENVFLNGTLLGYKHAEMKELFDSIVDFAELWDFIDAPLRTYSTGMAVRLGFAVATATRPDILIVDEVLSVGDERFQEKCAARMTEYRKGGTTILLVTHASAVIKKICDRAVWLDHGQIGLLGEVHEVVEAYHNKSSEQQGIQNTSPAPPRKSSMRAQSIKAAPQPPLKPMTQLEKTALQKQWLYQFELPCGEPTICLLPPEAQALHDTRWNLLLDALEPLCAGQWEKLRCLDLGCNQGYFSVKLAQLGCQHVTGVDARSSNIRDANLMRQIYELENLEFRQADLLELKPSDIGQFDVVLLFGMLYQLENPLGALRVAKSLATKAVIIETQLAPEVEGRMNWGAAHAFMPLSGSFALIDRTDDVDSFYGSLTSWALVPGLKALRHVMGKLGFTSIEVIPPAPAAHEQFTAGQRVVIAGYL
ncbi:MAG: ATP-binding cassette domain-containing protein [Acidobacteria bacterium]|nr:ATP-binding cassette domain-containing protein [Acidobacteriota bacterium]MBI3423619.1 ATP-binding cassette domain-containing protein [Acidobacteriota bacterium]